MTEAITRLNRSQPPPGYDVDDHSDVEFHWSAPDDRYDLGLDENCGTGTKAECIAAAWEHHETRNEPPGVLVTNGCWFAEGGPGHAPVDGGRTAVLKTAWAHYWRADALAKRLSAGPFAPLLCDCSKPPTAWNGRGASVCCHSGEYLRILSTDFWLALRGAHGDQLDVVDRWLAEGGKLPEVLRQVLDLREEASLTRSIARLNRSRRPPGYQVFKARAGLAWSWHTTVSREDGHLGVREALAAAWTHYESEHDPPGMWDFWLFREGARAAAWAWYWRRVAIVETVEKVCEVDGVPVPSIWPHALFLTETECGETDAWAEQRGSAPRWLIALAEGAP